MADFDCCMISKMDKGRKRSRHHFEREKSPKKERKNRSLVWEDHRSTLDELFFRNSDLIKRGSQEYKDFWLFLERYESFHQRHAEKHPRSERTKDRVSPKLGLPLLYDRRYKINVALLSKDVTDVTQYSTSGKKRVYSKDERTSGELTREEFSEFKSILLFYVDFCQKQKFSKLVKLKKDQANLPISHFKDQIVDAIGGHQVIIIAGDTGCGKSTQVPQYLLHAGFTRIACTQPRRIACISLAKRVGYETLNEYGSQVGYQIRFEASKTRATRILFLTEGLLLRQLSSDPTLSQYSVIVVDEVHERHIHGDFLLGVLRGLLQARADLKLVLMSATINISLFAGYFTGAPVIQIPGRLFPIEVRYQPTNVEQVSSSSSRSERLDPSPYLRIMQLIDHKYPSSERGDVLMFLSGLSEISAVVDAAREYAQRTRRWVVLPLHSSLSVEEQDKVFDVSPEGVRKCVVSTNIAETSITIDGIRFIVDSGKVKEMSYDPEAKMQRLREFWISQASAEQRKGRAGRTGPGVCFRLYSESDYHAFSQYTTPEIHRVPLDSIILQMVSLGITHIREFPFIEPPPASNVENSIHFLKQQGALTDSENLTPIGHMLAQLPVDVVVGKMLLIGSVFHVIEPVMVIAAALSVQSPFTRRLDHDPDVTSLRQPLESDHGDPFTLLNAYDEWLQIKSREGSSRKWCKRRGLEEQRFYEISKLKRQFEQLLRDHRLIERNERDKEEYELDREEDKWRKLKKLKREHRKSSRKTKMLKLDEDGCSESEDNSAADIRDLEFKLTHDLDKLQAGSAARRSFTLREINLLKIILCSGLYPNLAVADEGNSGKRDSEQLFHSQSKQFLLIHPTSVFATCPDILLPMEAPTTQPTPSKQQTQSSSNHQLLSFVSLLETNKPYLVNAMRVPALQTLLLFAQSLDTNADLTRFVVDCWIEICLPDSASGHKVLTAVQQLRVTWALLIKLRFVVSEDTEREERSSATRRNKERDLEHVLAKKLSEFLDSDVRYSLRRLLPSESQHLYFGPIRQTEEYVDFKEEFSFAAASEPHPVKGGFRVNDYLTYNCLQDTLMAEAASAAAQYIAKHWRCEKCGKKMLVTVLERLQHQEECQHDEPSGDSAVSDPGSTQSQTTNKESAAESSIERLRNPYYCSTCQQQFSFTSTEILKHKRSHAAAT